MAYNCMTNFFEEDHGRFEPSLISFFEDCEALIQRKFRIFQHDTL